MCGHDLSFSAYEIGDHGFNLIVGHATLKTASYKVAKHKKMYSNNQHVFIPIAMLCYLVYGCCILHVLSSIKN